jgi:hypothetical protein
MYKQPRSGDLSPPHSCYTQTVAAVYVGTKLSNRANCCTNSDHCAIAGDHRPPYSSLFDWYNTWSHTGQSGIGAEAEKSAQPEGERAVLTRRRCCILLSPSPFACIWCIALRHQRTTRTELCVLRFLGSFDPLLSATFESRLMLSCSALDKYPLQTWSHHTTGQRKDNRTKSELGACGAQLGQSCSDAKSPDNGSSGTARSLCAEPPAHDTQMRNRRTADTGRQGRGKVGNGK